MSVAVPFMIEPTASSSGAKASVMPGTEGGKMAFSTDGAMEAVKGKGPEAQAAAVKEGNMMAAAVLGFSAAIGAYGGFFIPKTYGMSLTMTGGVHAALWGFIGFYVTCVAITWWFYARKGAERPC